MPTSLGVIAALAGAVSVLGLSEVAFSVRRRFDPTSPWVAAWCAATVLYLAGRYLEHGGGSDEVLGARIRFLAAVPLLMMSPGIARARAQRPLSGRTSTILAGITVSMMALDWWSPLAIAAPITAAVIGVIFVYTSRTLLDAKSVPMKRRLVSAAIALLIGAFALNDVLLQLHLVRSVHLVEYVLVSLPALHNYRLVKDIGQHNRVLQSAVDAQTAQLLGRTTELEAAVLEARTARDEVDRSRRQLEHADRLASIGTLAAGVAHEINNPLSAVLGNLNLLRDGCPPSEPSGSAGSLLEDALDGAWRVQAIVRDLKAFSDPRGEIKESVQLDECIDAALALVGNLVSQQAVIERHVRATPTVQAGRLRLSQVLINLLRNAADALNELRPGQREGNRIRIESGMAAPGWAFVSVSDNGPGIAPELVPRLFDPFVTTKAIGSGSGLGLSVCHGIVTALGGKIEVESRLGVGATFTVSLPTEATGPAESAVSVAMIGPKESSSSMSSPPEPARRRILIVDDDPLVTRSMARALREHDVTLSSAGEDAVARCRVTTFDVVLCDLMMPGMTGIDIHAALLDLGQADRLVIVTGGAFTEKAERFLEEVAVRRLQKPVDIQVLRRMVAESPAAPQPAR